MSTNKSKVIHEDEPTPAINNLLTVGDSFCRLLMLFDIIIDTDTVRTMIIDDDRRLKTMCDYYGIELSYVEHKLLMDHLTKIRRDRMRIIFMKNDSLVTEARISFIAVLENAFDGKV